MTGFHCSFQREDSINLTSIVSAGYRVTVSNKNIGLVVRIRIHFTIVLGSVIRSSCPPSRLIQTLPVYLCISSPKSIHHQNDLDRVQILPGHLGYLLTAPPYGQVWHKAFFWWVRTQGRSPHAPGISQKCLRPRWHSPYYRRLRRRAMNATSQKGVKAWGDGSLRPKEKKNRY